MYIAWTVFIQEHKQNIQFIKQSVWFETIFFGARLFSKQSATQFDKKW
jgi:hypothetical protein